jgi:tRNA/tmRNA/rRNA uracil-C5-methylase (TrmA/RlmC/RlmD family)
MKTLIRSYMPRLMDPAQILAELTAPRSSSTPVSRTIPNPDLEFETFALREITAYLVLITKSPDTALADSATLTAETITTALRALKKTSAAVRDDVLDKQDAYWNVRDELDRRGYAWPLDPATFAQPTRTVTEQVVTALPTAWDSAFPGALPPTLDEILAAMGDDNA